MSEATPRPATSLHPFAEKTLGQIATELPGATAVFRRFKLDFCCGGNVNLATAAAKKQLSLAAIESELELLQPMDHEQLPSSTPALIDHILSRYHEVHRRELPELIRLSRRVEAVHRDHPEVPAGLADILDELYHELGAHMQKEEHVLFPLLLRGGHPMIAQPIAALRFEHDGHGGRLRAAETLAHGTVVPEGACPTWRALYAGVRKLIDDVMEHIHLENNLLFPQFAPVE